MADQVAEEEEQGVSASNGIWELRRPRQLVSADIGRWLVLDRAIWIARMRHPLRHRCRWKLVRQAHGGPSPLCDHRRWRPPPGLR